MLETLRRASARTEKEYNLLQNDSKDHGECVHYVRSIPRSHQDEYTGISVLDSSFIGMGADVEVGDIVYIIDGGSMPIVLRPVDSGNHKFVGEVYVQGVMDRELVGHETMWETFIIE